MALTDTGIKGKKPQTTAYKLKDSGGLYLLVTPSGGKLWRWNYRFCGKQKTMALGGYPDISLADIRTAHQTARTELAKGIDPMATRKAEKSAVRAEAQKEIPSDADSFRVIALKWHKWWEPGVERNTAAYIRRRLEADVFPVLGDKRINEIKPADIRKLIVTIQDGTGQGRRFKGKGAREVAQRHHGTISQIFRYAVVHELAEVNPAAAFRPGEVLSPHKLQNRAHIKAHQLPALLAAMEGYRGHALVKLAVKLMALTFVRTQELLRAPWSEVDLEHGFWNIDGARMKKGRAHIVPLSRQAISIFRELEKMASDSFFVFPGLNAQTTNGTINLNSILNALADLGYKGIMTGHGYRGLARTILAENGFEKAHVELQLAHTNDDKTDAAYNHALYLTQRTDLMQWWADYLDKQAARAASISLIA